MRTFSQKIVVLISIFAVVAFAAFFMLFQLYVSQENEKELSKQQMIQEAKAHFQSIVNTRAWNAQFGGVYVVKGNSGIEPNPYLKNNILFSDKNETLIKINPAWMTRQISTISNKQKEYVYKITSLKPLNPNNLADSFEKEALTYFEKKPQENFYYRFNEELNRFNFMGSLVVQKSCLKCHSHQGYEIGDIRGGIRVSLPLKLHNKQMMLLNEKTKNSAFYIILGAIAFLGMMIWLINLFYKRQYEIENANEILEKKVSERTSALKRVVSHEQNLKNLLKIITEVNELLITSYSTKAILENSARKLASNNTYSLILTGLINQNILEIVSQSASNNFVSENIILLNEDKKQNFFLDAINKSVELKHPIIEKVPNDFFKGCTKRKDDLNCKWFFVLPLLHGIENEPYGMITVFSSLETGFELEEMKILENMSHDISIALYSHKQHVAILEMEKEKTANYEETILAFVNIIEQRDTYTAGHTIRVAEYCKLIAKGMGLSETEIHRLEKAAILHDIGKVATPDTILLKPGKLSSLEYELIKQHSEVGANMLERISIYKDLAQIIRYHHSRYDGKGYPKTSSPDDIPMLSHVMIVSDAFDAMTTNRIYRPRKSIDEALAELKNLSSIQFHPDVVDVAVKVLKDVNLSNTTQMPESELEQRRMSYFFQDNLTGLYNEDYLQIVLNGEKSSFKSVNIIDLHNFSRYNQNYGWEAGNVLLKNIANLLEELYPQSMLIRYHGDDFVMLDAEQNKIVSSEILENKLFKDSEVTMDVNYYEIDEYFTFELFQNLKKNLKVEE